MSNEDIIKGYQVDKDRYLEVTKEELENIALKLTRTIEIDEFVPRKEIDDLYLVRPYYIAGWQGRSRRLCGHPSTLFARHKLPLKGYLAAIAVFCNEVKGKSALALSRDLGLS